jgi:hypothetical protein
MANIRSQKEMLDTLRAFMEDDTVPASERKGVYDVLTALRGPDNDDWDLKDQTTAVIRYAALGRVALGDAGAIVHRDHPTYALARQNFGALYEPHFMGHAKLAFAALGLKWNDYNAS